jgi:MFS family permease
VTQVRTLTRQVFHGWWIVSGAMMMQALISALFLQAYGVYATFWMSEFGWSRTTVSLAYSLHRTENGLLGPLHGWLLQHVSPRLVILAGVLVLGAGFIVLSRVQNLTQFIAVFLTMAVGASLAGILSLMTVIVNWFDQRRATALALLTTGLSIGGLAVPLVATGMVTFGWRAVAAASGLLVLLAGIPIARIMHHSPEMLGLRPDGQGQDALPGSEARQLSATVSPVTLGQALRTGAFWLLSFGHATAIAVVSAVTVHFVIYAQTAVGLSITVAAALVTLLTALTMIGQLLGGLFGDRIDKRWLAGGGMLGHAAAMACLAWASAPALVVIATILHGLSWGVRGPLMGAMRADYFGRETFAMIMGTSSLVVMMGSVGGPLVVGLLADATGRYSFAFLVLCAVSVTGAGAFFALGKPAPTTFVTQT